MPGEMSESGLFETEGDEVDRVTLRAVLAMVGGIDLGPVVACPGPSPALVRPRKRPAEVVLCEPAWNLGVVLRGP